MIYNNSAKDYVLIGLAFGIPMGILFGLVEWSIPLGIVLGVLCGALFGGFICLFSKTEEKKYGKMRSEIARERKIFCDGAATVQGNGGWLFFTEYGLEFYPHKYNLSQNEVRIPLGEIRSVKIGKRNQILLDTTETTELPAFVVRKEEWAEQIQRQIQT